MLLAEMHTAPHFCLSLQLLLATVHFASCYVSALPRWQGTFREMPPALPLYCTMHGAVSICVSACSTGVMACCGRKLTVPCRCLHSHVFDCLSVNASTAGNAPHGLVNDQWSYAAFCHLIPAFLTPPPPTPSRPPCSPSPPCPCCHTRTRSTAILTPPPWQQCRLSCAACWSPRGQRGRRRGLQVSLRARAWHRTRTHRQSPTRRWDAALCCVVSRCRQVMRGPLGTHSASVSAFDLPLQFRSSSCYGFCASSILPCILNYALLG